MSAEPVYRIAIKRKHTHPTVGPCIAHIRCGSPKIQSNAEKTNASQLFAINNPNMFCLSYTSIVEKIYAMEGINLCLRKTDVSRV